MLSIIGIILAIIGLDTGYFLRRAILRSWRTDFGLLRMANMVLILSGLLLVHSVFLT
jgi:hypothetical protein